MGDPDSSGWLNMIKPYFQYVYISSTAQVRGGSFNDRQL